MIESVAYWVMFIISFRYLVWFGTKIFFDEVLGWADLLLVAFMALLWPISVPLTIIAFVLSVVFGWLSDNNVLQPLLDLMNKWAKNDRS